MCDQFRDTTLSSLYTFDGKDKNAMGTIEGSIIPRYASHAHVAASATTVVRRCRRRSGKHGCLREYGRTEAPERTAVIRWSPHTPASCSCGDGAERHLNLERAQSTHPCPARAAAILSRSGRGRFPRVLSIVPARLQNHFVCRTGLMVLQCVRAVPYKILVRAHPPIFPCHPCIPPSRSIRTTSAPRSAINTAQCGPGPILANSSTRRPVNGPDRDEGLVIPSYRWSARRAAHAVPAAVWRNEGLPAHAIGRTPASLEK